MQSLPEGYRLRPANIADSPVAAHHRAAMFHEMKALSVEDLPEFQTNSEHWQRGVFADGSYQGWVVEHESKIVAGGGLLVSFVGPIPGIPFVSKNAHIVNIYTEPEHRRQGVARALMLWMLDWCRDNEIRDVTLNASEEGYSLYVSLGFARSMHMRLQHLK